MAYRLIFTFLILTLFSFQEVEQLSKLEREELADEIATAGYHYRQSGEIQQTYMDSAIAICPWCAGIYRSKAVWAIKSGRYKKHFDLLEKAVELDSSIIEYRGTNQLMARNYQAAIKDLIALDKMTDDPDDYSRGKHIYHQIGNAQLLDHQYSSARKSFTKVIAYQSKGGFKWVDHNVYMGRALAAFRLGDLSNASADLDSTLMIYSDCPEAHYYQAMISNKTQQFGPAFEHLNKALEAVDYLNPKEGFRVTADSIRRELNELQRNIDRR